MVRKIMQWVPITVLLLAVTWRPSANYQILLHFMVCVSAVLVILALFAIKQRIEAHYGVYGVNNGSNPTSRVTVKV